MQNIYCNGIIFLGSKIFRPNVLGFCFAFATVDVNAGHVAPACTYLYLIGRQLGLVGIGPLQNLMNVFELFGSTQGSRESKQDNERLFKRFEVNKCILSLWSSGAAGFTLYRKEQVVDV